MGTVGGLGFHADVSSQLCCIIIHTTEIHRLKSLINYILLTPAQKHNKTQEHGSQSWCVWAVCVTWVQISRMCVCVCVCWCVGGGGTRAVLESWTGPGGHCGWLPLTDGVTAGRSLPLSDLSCANL